MLDQHSILAPIQAPPTLYNLSSWLEQLKIVLELYSAQMQLCCDSITLSRVPELSAVQITTGHLANDCFLLTEVIKKSQNYLNSLENNNLEKGGENA